MPQAFIIMQIGNPELLPLFAQPAGYAAFEQILAEAVERTGIRIAAYCLMPNHWHLLLRNELSDPFSTAFDACGLTPNHRMELN